MRYEPKVLINRTGEVVEFKCGGTTYIHKPKRKKPYEGFVAHHALHVTNTGLEEVGGKVNKKIIRKSEVLEETLQANKMVEIMSKQELMELPWKQLLKKIGARKKFKPGMNREQIVAILKDE